MATQIDFLLSQVRTTADGALIGGKAYFYESGTTTLKTVWTDRNETNISPNPVTLDSNALAGVYGSGVYRIVIKDAAGVAKLDYEGISSAGGSGSAISVNCTSGGVTVTLPTGGQAAYLKTDSTANAITVTPTAGQTINGLASVKINSEGELLRFTYDATTNMWYEG